MSTHKPNNPISDEEFDGFVKNLLEGNNIQPPASNWKSVRRKTIVPSIFKTLKQSSFLYAAATVLLIFSLFKFSNFDHFNSAKPLAQQAPIAAPIQSAYVSTCEQKENTFVMDISSTPEINEDEKIIRKEIIDKEIDDYLAFLLSDDDFEREIDSVGIAEGLAKVDQLPIDEMFTNIPDLPKAKVYTILTPLAKRITLPHRFVESEKAVEDYLAHYEKNQRKLMQY